VQYAGRLERYIFFQTAMGVAVAAGAVCVAIVLVDLVEQLRSYAGQGDNGAWIALRFTAMRLPGILEQALPFAVLVGSIVTFLGLSRSSEVVAMRASGVSTWRFLAPVGVLSAVVGLIATLILSPTAATLNQAYEHDKERLVAADASAVEREGANLIWLKDRSDSEQYLISAKPVGADLFENASIIVLDGESGFQMRYEARVAERTAREWILKDGLRLRLGLSDEPFAETRLPRAVATGSSVDEAQARGIAIWALPAAARLAAANGGSAGRYWLRFHRLAALPITLFSMGVIAALLSLNNDRAGQRALMIAAATAAGLGVYFVSDFAGALATAGYAPAWVAAWSPPIAALFLALAAVSFREDG
jgi:lipopolysaccharide export system permease protein